MSVEEDIPLVVITKKNATQTAIPGDFHRCQTLTTAQIFSEFPTESFAVVCDFSVASYLF